MTERYLDDFAVGQKFGSGRLRIAEKQIKSFAAEFDPQPFHLDPETARNTILGGRSASGTSADGPTCSPRRSDRRTRQVNHVCPPIEELSAETDWFCIEVRAATSRRRKETRVIALGSRAHTFARPDSKDNLIWFFTTVLGCDVLERPDGSVSRDAAGRPTPVYAFRFPNGGAFSVEFTEDALDEAHARRGAYLELQSDDPPALKEKILAADVSQVEPFDSDYLYFQAPGGQVWRIVPARERKESDG